MSDPGAAPERTALAHIRTACCAVTLAAVTLHLAPSPAAVTALAALTVLVTGCCGIRARRLHTAKDRPMSPAAAILAVAALILQGGLILGLM